MPPKQSKSVPLPLRSLSKKDSKRLPQSKKVQYLYAAAVAMSTRNPKYSSYLGRRCLAEMTRCVQPHGLSNTDVARLCKRCGCAYAEGTGEVVALSASTVRRSQRAVFESKKKKNPGVRRAAVLRGGIECVCRACGNTSPVYKYPTVEVAAEILLKKKSQKEEVDKPR